MTVWIERDKYDFEMFHVYSKQRSTAASFVSKYLCFTIHGDMLDMFGKEFHSQLREMFEEGETEICINLEGTIEAD
jgi:hypothetical protein